jgi:hypothetical protein
VCKETAYSRASNGDANDVLTLVKTCDTTVAMGLILEIVTRAICVHSNPFSTKSCSLFAAHEVLELHVRAKKLGVHVPSMIRGFRVRSAGYASEVLILLKTVVTAVVT